MGLLLPLAVFLHQTGQFTAESVGGVPLGFIVLSIVITPVLVITLLAMLVAPRTFRLPGLFLTSVVLLISAVVSSFALASWVLGFFVPG